PHARDVRQSLDHRWSPLRLEPPPVRPRTARAAAQAPRRAVTPLVIHLLPVDAARGAQSYASELRGAMNDASVQHRTLTLFRSRGGTLHPDSELDAPNGRLRALGFDPRAVFRLRRWLRDARPAVVVAHGGEPLKYAVLAGVPRSRLVYLKIGV